MLISYVFVLVYHSSLSLPLGGYIVEDSRRKISQKLKQQNKRKLNWVSLSLRRRRRREYKFL